eukprot:g46319.t1
MSNLAPLSIYRISVVTLTFKSSPDLPCAKPRTTRHAVGICQKIGFLAPAPFLKGHHGKTSHYRVGRACSNRVVSNINFLTHPEEKNLVFTRQDQNHLCWDIKTTMSCQLAQMLTAQSQSGGHLTATALQLAQEEMPQAEGIVRDQASNQPQAGEASVKSANWDFVHMCREEQKQQTGMRDSMAFLAQKLHSITQPIDPQDLKHGHSGGKAPDIHSKGPFRMRKQGDISKTQGYQAKPPGSMASTAEQVPAAVPGPILDPSYHAHYTTTSHHS